MEGDLMAIAQAAKKLGLSRSRLSVILKERKIPMVEHGTVKLVSFTTVQNVILERAAQGRMRGPRRAQRPQPAQQDIASDVLVALTEELKVIRAERKELQEQLEATRRELLTIKLLAAPAAVTDPLLAEIRAISGQVTALSGQVETLRRGATAASPTFPVLKDPTDVVAIAALVEQCRGIEPSGEQEPLGFWTRLFQTKSPALRLFLPNPSKR